MMWPRVRLAIAVAAFVAWIGWLAIAVFSNGKVPVVSRAQLTAATCLVVADIALDDQALPKDSITVSAVISGGDTKVGGQFTVGNLSKSIAAGRYATPMPGPHLIPLAKAADGSWKVAGLPPSPGYQVVDPDRPLIYPWNDDVKKQMRALGFEVP
jgi:hypothetical protein